MRILFLLSFTLFLVSNIFAQPDTVFVKQNSSYDEDSIKYKTDTIIFSNTMNRTILAGTTKVPMSSNQLDARRFNICLNSIKSSDCMNTSGDRLGKTEVKSVTINDTNIVIRIKIVSNCCFNFLCDIGASNDSTLNVIAYDYGSTHCACDCCFEIEYFLSNNCFGKGLNTYTKMTGIVINSDEKTYYRILNNSH